MTLPLGKPADASPAPQRLAPGPPTSSTFSATAGAEALLAAALGRVSTALPYLRALVGPPPQVLSPGEEVSDGLWWNCDELLGNSAWFEATVTAAGKRLGAPSPAVAASLFVQGYAYRVLTLAVCCLLLEGALPASGPAEMAMALSRGRPAYVSYRYPKVLKLGGPPLQSAGGPPLHSAGGPPLWGTGAGEALRALAADANEALRALAADANEALRALAADAIEGHLRPLVETTLGSFRVGRRLLWGNVAASAATAFRTVEGLAGPAVKPLGEKFFNLVPAEMKGQGSFFSLEHAGRRGWYWERRNCCLYYQLPGNLRCADCSLTPRDERRAAYRASLEAATSNG